MAYSAEYDKTGVEYYEIPSFKFHEGTEIPVKVAYRSYNSSSKKTVLIPTCYGGLINNTLNYTSGAFKDYHVVVTAMLGNGESSSPSNTPGFPKSLDYRDCVTSQYMLLTDHLGVKELDAVTGFSMGGQQAYYWGVQYPKFVKVVIPIASSARTSYHNWAFLEGPKAALLNSVDYADGEYKAKGIHPKRGLAAFGRAYCAWALSAAWFREKKFEEMGFKSMEEFMLQRWEKGFQGWDPEDVLILARMWQAGDVGALRDDGSFEKALESIEARTLVMPTRTDQYFRFEDSENEVKYLKHGTLAIVETIWGHMGGGGAHDEDTKWMDQRISQYMKGS